MLVLPAATFSAAEGFYSELYYGKNMASMQAIPCLCLLLFSVADFSLDSSCYSFPVSSSDFSISWFFFRVRFLNLFLRLVSVHDKYLGRCLKYLYEGCPWHVIVNRTAQG